MNQHITWRLSWKTRKLKTSTFPVKQGRSLFSVVIIKAKAAFGNDTFSILCLQVSPWQAQNPQNQPEIKKGFMGVLEQSRMVVRLRFDWPVSSRGAELSEESFVFIILPFTWFWLRNFWNNCVYLTSYQTYTHMIDQTLSTGNHEQRWPPCLSRVESFQKGKRGHLFSLRPNAAASNDTTVFFPLSYPPPPPLPRLPGNCNGIGDVKVGWVVIRNIPSVIRCIGLP